MNFIILGDFQWTLQAFTDKKRNTTRYVAVAPCCRRRTKRPRLSLCCSGPGVKHYESPPGWVRNETQGGIEDATEAPSIRSLVC